MKARFLKIINSPETSFDVKKATSRYFNTPWHFHPELELNHLVSSTGIRFVGDNIERFAPGDLVLLGPNLPHLWKNDSVYYNSRHLKAIAVNIRFSVEQLSFLSGGMPEFAQVSKLIERSRRGIIINGRKKKLVVELMTTIQEHTGLKKLITLLTILDILSDTKDYRFLSSEGFTISNRVKAEKRMNIVYNYVLENYDREISLKKTAEILHMNASSFSRFFKHCSGKSFSDFIIEARLNEACKMLVETDLSVTSILYKCGFNNQANFNTLFKKKTGIKPLQYRKNYPNLK